MHWKKKIAEKIKEAVPLAAGTGIGAGTALFSIACTVPKTGVCSTCGSCIFAIVSLSGWAIAKKGSGNSIYSKTDQ